MSEKYRKPFHILCLASRALIVLWSVCFGFPIASAEAGPRPPSDPPPTSCHRQFSDSPQQFLRKALAVADEVDLAALPLRVSESFGVKLQRKASDDGTLISYTLLEPCSWFTRLGIQYLSDQTHLPDPPHAAVQIGDAQQLLDFGDPNNGDCLRPEIVDATLKSDGWDGGSTKWELVLWSYRKGRTHIDFIPRGSYGSDPHKYQCIAQIYIQFT
jgi:hypothetical protein